MTHQNNWTGFCFCKKTHLAQLKFHFKHMDLRHRTKKTNSFPQVLIRVKRSIKLPITKHLYFLALNIFPETKWSSWRTHRLGSEEATPLRARSSNRNSFSAPQKTGLLQVKAELVVFIIFSQLKTTSTLKIRQVFLRPKSRGSSGGLQPSVSVHWHFPPWRCMSARVRKIIKDRRPRKVWSFLMFLDTWYLKSILYSSGILLLLQGDLYFCLSWRPKHSKEHHKVRTK